MGYVNKEEKESIETYEQDEWICTHEKIKGGMKKASRKKSKKNKRINIRLHLKGLPRYPGKGHGRMHFSVFNQLTKNTTRTVKLIQGLTK